MQTDHAYLHGMGTAKESIADLLAELQAGLVIDENALEEAVQNQPVLFHKVSERLTLELSRRDAYKQYMAEARAKALVRIRHKLRYDEERVTTAEVSAMVTMDIDVQKAVDRYLDKCELVGQLQTLKDSFAQRRYALRDLVELYLHNYYGDVPQGRPRREELRDRQATEIRANMSRQRNAAEAARGRRNAPVE